MNMLTVRDLVTLLKMDRGLIYQLIECNAFPKPSILSTAKKHPKYRWLEQDILDWIHTKKVK